MWRSARRRLWDVSSQSSGGFCSDLMAMRSATIARSFRLDQYAAHDRSPDQCECLTADVAHRGDIARGVPTEHADVPRAFFEHLPATMRAHAVLHGCDSPCCVEHHVTVGGPL